MTTTPIPTRLTHISTALATLHRLHTETGETDDGAIIEAQTLYPHAFALATRAVELQLHLEDVMHAAYDAEDVSEPRHAGSGQTINAARRRNATIQIDTDPPTEETHDMLDLHLTTIEDF